MVWQDAAQPGFDPLDDGVLQVLESFAQVELRPGLDRKPMRGARAAADALRMRGRIRGAVERFAGAPRLRRQGRAGVGLDGFAREPRGRCTLWPPGRIGAALDFAGPTTESLVRPARDLTEGFLAVLQGQPVRWRVR